MNKKLLKISTVVLCLVTIFMVSISCDKDLSETPENNEFTDSRDGKIYEYVTIGSQTWMAENLNFATSNGSWCYDNNASNCNSYGSLYNWDAANSACPSGWHLPSDDEWTVLEQYLGMASTEIDNKGDRKTGDVGNKLKTASGWNGGGNGSNESGFNAKPVGTYSITEGFQPQGDRTIFWASQASSSRAWSRRLHHDSAGVYRYNDIKGHGFSVRCLQN